MGETVVDTDEFLKITVRDFLENDVETHFNWDLEKLDTKYFPVLETFEAKLKDKDLIVETPWILKWTLKLSYGYEKFKVEKYSGLKIVQEALAEMESTQDSLFLNYKVAFRHVACSLLAIMVLETDWDTDKLHDLMLKIKVLDDMSDEEKSGVFGLKAYVLRWYGPDGTKATIQEIMEATSLHPDEYEWKICQAVAYTRMRHFSRNPSLADVAVPKEILEKLLKRKDVIGDREVTCKYYLAVTLKDLILMQDMDSEEKSKTNESLKRLCSEILTAKTTSPQVISFCAEQIAYINGDPSSGISIILESLTKFPRHIGLNTTISKLYIKAKNNSKVLEHSKIALDEGGYGAAFIYLECMALCRNQIKFERFFRSLIKQHPASFKVKIHVYAALFYFILRRNIPKGSYHTKLALETDPSHGDITYCKWKFTWVNLLEIAYNQIHISLHQCTLDPRQRASLKGVQEKISIHTDVSGFVVSTDLVQDLWKKKKQWAIKT